MYRFVAFCLTVSAVWASPVSAATHVVAPDATGGFPTIQAAIDASLDGDVILLEDGVYRGEGNRDIDFRGKSIAVLAQP